MHHAPIIDLAMDVNGKLRVIEIPAYYVPESPVKLLSTAQTLQHYDGETIVLDDQAATLSGLKGDPTRGQVKALVNPYNNIPTCTGYRLTDVNTAAISLNNLTATVGQENINLSEPEN